MEEQKTATEGLQGQQHLVEGQKFKFRKSGTEYVIGKGGVARRTSGKLWPKKFRNRLKKVNQEIQPPDTRQPGDPDILASIATNIYEYQQQRGSIV